MSFCTHQAEKSREKFDDFSLLLVSRRLRSAGLAQLSAYVYFFVRDA
jgi:hypothetical protein